MKQKKEWENGLCFAKCKWQPQLNVLKKKL